MPPIFCQLIQERRHARYRQTRPTWAVQCFSIMEVTQNLALHLMAASARNTRSYDGPSEVHCMVVAHYLTGKTYGFSCWEG